MGIMAKVITKKIDLKLSLPVSFLREGDCFIAYSPALDLSTSADSFEKAKKRFTEAVEIFFEELLEKGTLNEVLAELGWQKVKKQWMPPVVVAQESVKFDISDSLLTCLTSPQSVA
jgi:predicted RNase H-like HicB family nuclease